MSETYNVTVKDHNGNQSVRQTNVPQNKSAADHIRETIGTLADVATIVGFAVATRGKVKK